MSPDITRLLVGADKRSSLAECGSAARVLTGTPAVTAPSTANDRAPSAPQFPPKNLISRLASRAPLPCGTRPRGSPERHHSHYPALGRPIRPYEWTVQPRGERDRTQFCHGSPDESGQSSLSGDWARMARIAKKKFVHSTTSYVAIGEYASAVPGSHRAWSGDPARALHAWRTAPTR